MELLNPNVGLIFWMLLVFGLLFLVLRRFAWKPILGAIHKREKHIEEALHLAEKTRAEMEQLHYDNKVLYNQAREERDEILKEARAIKESIIEESKKKAETEADRILMAARESIDFEKMAAITELKNQLAQMAIDIAEKVLERELSTPDKHKDVIEKEMADLHF
ncbi:MAG TPA: F0F1 ATP synthase subunit B [Bacteroidales bacterium]|nr:F0F1 ATP synthase subunit B [Bacteroidales bacterium]HRZ47975.1 F0F1 ATP synthase subunit B [Bacteroidales bacterium]